MSGLVCTECQVWYAKLCMKLLFNLSSVSDQNIPPTEPRIPQRQLLVEMAAMIKQHVRDLMGTDVKSVIRPLKKYSPQYNEANIPHTEIILYEDEETDLTRSSFQQTRQ